MSQNGEVSPIRHGDVEVENALNLLLREGYLLGAPDVGVISLTNKLARFYKEKMTNLVIPNPTSVQSIKEEKITIQDFKVKAEIPWKVTSNKGKANEFTYNTGQISVAAERFFNSKVVGKVNMNTLIEVTKAFYKDESAARPTLTNFFINGLWEDIYKNYKPTSTSRVIKPLRL